LVGVASGEWTAPATSHSVLKAEENPLGKSVHFVQSALAYGKMIDYDLALPDLSTD
jgi:hypothetical protein